MNTIAIPARLDSTRLVRKLLQPVAGRPVIWHTIQRALESKLADRVVVLSSDAEILHIVNDFGLPVFVEATPPADSGTARIISMRDYFGNGVVVNLQADEPLLNGSYIDQAFAIAESEGVITTLAAPLSPNEYRSEHVVKVVTTNDGRALYFSRSPIPFGNYEVALRHIGLYAFPTGLLRSLPGSSRYLCEKLEQLAWLLEGWIVRVLAVDAAHVFSIDTSEDYIRLCEYMEQAAAAADRIVRADKVAYPPRHNW